MNRNFESLSGMRTRERERNIFRGNGNKIFLTGTEMREWEQLFRLQEWERETGMGTTFSFTGMGTGNGNREKLFP
jgi:hypothetical protein